MAHKLSTTAKRRELPDVRVVRAQQFADGPRLRETADGTMRRVGIENFRRAAEAGFVQMGDQAGQEAGNLLLLGLAGAVDLRVRVAIRADEPAPHGALVVGAITLPTVAGVF